MIKLAPVETIKLAPVEIACAIFRIQLPPGAGEIIIVAPAGKVLGGMLLPLQLAAKVHTPLPVNVYVCAEMLRKEIKNNTSKIVFFMILIN